jgi:FkbM family methyltransferase
MKRMMKHILRQLSILIAIYSARRFKYKKDRSVLKVKNKRFRIIDGSNFYIQYKDIFIRRIYEFETSNPNPVILDGGSNIGTSILFFTLKYPNAKVIAFEPDPAVFNILSENVQQMKCQNISLINAGLGGMEGKAFFRPDGNVGGSISETRMGSIQVSIVPLSSYLESSIDYLKLNIEGLEYDVLSEVEKAGLLGNIKQLAIEYHGWVDGRQSLGEILEILERNHFRYMLHDFDAETCFSTKPPIRFSQKSNWFCMIYAINLDS